MNLTIGKWWICWRFQGNKAKKKKKTGELTTKCWRGKRTYLTQKTVPTKGEFTSKNDGFSKKFADAGTEISGFSLTYFGQRLVA